jgi:hypothetical protein
MHAQFFHQPSLTGDAIEIPEQQNPQQHFRINRRTSRLTVRVAQFFAHKLKADVAINQPQQMVSGT